MLHRYRAHSGRISGLEDPETQVLKMSVDRHSVTHVVLVTFDITILFSFSYHDPEPFCGRSRTSNSLSPTSRSYRSHLHTPSHVYTCTLAGDRSQYRHRNENACHHYICIRFWSCTLFVILMLSTCLPEMPTKIWPCIDSHIPPPPCIHRYHDRPEYDLRDS